MAFRLAPISGKGFIGRKALLAEMTTELASKNKIGYSLLGMRKPTILDLDIRPQRSTTCPII